MNTRKMSKILLLSVLASSSAPAWAANVYAPTAPDNDTNVPPRNLSTIGPASAELFTTYVGSQATLSPLGFYVSNDPNTPAFGGINTGTNGTAGFYAYGPFNGHYAAGLLEASGTTDSRLYLKLRNDTGGSLSRLLVSYDLEQWRDGARVNQMGLRYSPVWNDFSSYSDVVTTATTSPLGNPSTAAAVNPPAVQSVTAFIALPVVLTNGTSGFLRWGYSSPGSGSRDGFGPTNIKIVPLGSGTSTLVRSGTTGTNWFASGSWTTPSYVWAGTANNAQFTNTALSPVILDGNATAVDVLFNDSFTITDSSTPVLTVTGIINVAAGETGTIDSKLDTPYGVFKLGDGELVVSEVVTTKGISVLDGTLSLGADNAINKANSLSVNNASGAVFKTAGFDVTVDALIAPEDADNVVDLGSSGSSILTIDMDIASTASYRGSIIGSDAGAKIVKEGAGRQRFRSSTKTYAATTVVNEGQLELTQNADLPNTADVKLNGVTSLTASPDTHGTLLLSNDGGTDKTFTIGSSVTIDIKGGAIAAEAAVTADSITLPNNIAFDTTDIGGVNPAHNNIDSDATSGGIKTDFILTGNLTGGGFRKVGDGFLRLNPTTGSNTNDYLEIRNGIVVAEKTGAITKDLYFQDKANDRVLEVQANTVVTYLDGNSPDPDIPQDVIDFPGGLMKATAFLDIPSGKTFTVDYDAEFIPTTSEENKPSFEGNIRGVSSTYGTFIKDGTGTERLTTWPKTGAVTYTVNDGVLQVSFNGRIQNAARIDVNRQPAADTGGQLRLSTGVSSLGSIANATYNFGGTLYLNTLGRTIAGIVVDNAGFGTKGALRFDPSTGVQFGALASAVEIASEADIHINGLEKVFYLDGALTGSATLHTSGGGQVVINGTASGFGGDIKQDNGSVWVASGKTLGTLATTDVTVGDTTSNDNAELGGAGTVAGNVTVTSKGLLAGAEGVTYVLGEPQGNGVWAPVGPLTITGNVNVNTGATVVPDLTVTPTPVSVGGNMVFGANWKVDLKGATLASGDYDLFVLASGKTVTGSPTTVTFVNGSNTPTATIAVKGLTVKTVTIRVP